MGKKRLFSAVLVCLLLVLMPLFAYAEEDSFVDKVVDAVKSFLRPEVTGNAVFLGPIEVVNAYVSPAKVRPGDTLTVTIGLKDSNGINSVKASIEHENGWDDVNMVLIAGDKYDGTYEVKWKVHDTIVKLYDVKVQIENGIGFKAEHMLEYYDPPGADPGHPVTQIDWSNAINEDVNVGTGSLAVDTSTLVVNSVNNRVGIGTDNPAQNLQVKGIVGFEGTDATDYWAVFAHTDNSLRFNYNAAGNDEVTIDNAGNVAIAGSITGAVANPQDYGAISVKGGKGGYSGISYYKADGVYVGTFMVRESDALSGMHIDDTGWKWYFGDYGLHVPESGAAGVTGGYNLGRWPAADSTNNEWLYLSSGTSTAAAPVYQNLAVGKLHGSTHVESTAFIYVSDRSLKKNIRSIPNALERVQQLEGVNFQWKKNDKESMGLIANDVENIFPEIVSTDSEGLKQLEYGNLVAALVEAVKEQQKEIDSLKQEVESLK